jgi:hypothetical protein
VGNPEKSRNVRVPATLLEHAETRIDEDDRDGRRRCARDHVACVLNVARGVRDDELSLVGAEIPISDIDRDALLALRCKAIGEKRQVEVHSLGVRGASHGFELIRVDRAGVVKQAPDERRFAVVDRADCDEAQELLLLVAAQVRFDVRRDELTLGSHQK